MKRGITHSESNWNHVLHVWMEQKSLQNIQEGQYCELH